jgi:DNA recombination protein RmuC
MVIDSKASKFFTELAKEHLGEEEQILNEKLKATMRTHLKDIIVKDYKEAVRKHLTKIRGTSNISNISTVMFLPSETALEKLQMIDKDFLYKAWENGVYPAGPVGIINILAHAKFQIIEEKQAENHLLINEEVRKLLSSISTLHDYMRKIGSSIHSAASNFDKMAASFNNNLLPKVRNLNRLGVDSKQNKTVPLYLDRYHIISATMVENEQKTPEEILELEDLENK